MDLLLELLKKDTFIPQGGNFEVWWEKFTTSLLRISSGRSETCLEETLPPPPINRSLCSTLFHHDHECSARGSVAEQVPAGTTWPASWGGANKQPAAAVVDSAIAVNESGNKSVRSQTPLSDRTDCNARSRLASTTNEYRYRYSALRSLPHGRLAQNWPRFLRASSYLFRRWAARVKPN